MGAQLELWGGTVAGSDTRVSLEIRESARAKRLILQAVPPRTVEVVVPQGMRPGPVRKFIQAHRDWIRRAEQELVEAYPILDMQPAKITLAAIGRQFDVNYDKAQDGKPRYRDRSGELSLYCIAEDFSDAGLLLKRWLLREARANLKPWLLLEAERTGLMPRSIQVRLQKTRWGSCSSRGNISLNASLMLVAPELVRYLFVHELSHLRHLSHSKRYWKTVARHEPDFRRLDRELAASWRQIPSWLQFSG
ncbi:MAG: SprT family zinc-dependent metalloprotease [Gammaproteobacteria bacterium]|jgi:predicted metal-dependent hydrolase